MPCFDEMRFLPLENFRPERCCEGTDSGVELPLSDRSGNCIRASRNPIVKSHAAADPLFVEALHQHIQLLGYTGFDALRSPEAWRLDTRHLAAYDVVLSGQVLEHVRRLRIWIHQVASS
jgi:hypothetical protein